MKQYHIYFRNTEQFEQELSELKKGADGKTVLFRILSEELYTDEVDAVRGVLGKVFPEAPYIGMSTGGNIINCQSGEPVSLTALVFDSPTSRADVREYDTADSDLCDIAQDIVKYTEENPWVKSIELYYPIPKESTTDFCDLLSKMRSDIQITGGIICSPDISSDDCMLFSSASKSTHSDTAMAVAFYGGDDLNVLSLCIQGWQPLGRVFTVTKADGSIIYELDGISACDVYKKYLNVEGDENFFFNTLEFPLYIMCNSVPVLRTPLSANTDGSIMLSSDLEVGDEVRISYGDPVTIVNCITNDSKRLDDFMPDVMHVFSCVARKTYWSAKDPTYEISALAPISESSGFFSHGEFLRSDGVLVQHNVTLVISAMREGEKRMTGRSVNITEKSFSNTKMSLASRLATFIGVTSSELNATNRMLEKSAITDGLTGLYNRKEIQTRIENEICGSGCFSLVMLDIDNFKSVNDTYGHAQGDEVIIAISDILRDIAADIGVDASAGRWGGEEFMLLLCGASRDDAARTAETIRTRFAEKGYEAIPPQTISVGVTEFKDKESADSLCSRVDMALYTAKSSGKNRVVTV